MHLLSDTTQRNLVRYDPRTFTMVEGGDLYFKKKLIYIFITIFKYMFRSSS